MNNKPIISATNKTTPVSKTAKAPTIRPSMPGVPAKKVPATKPASRAVSNAVELATRITAMEVNIKSLCEKVADADLRYADLSGKYNALVGHCENLTKVIVSVQTSLIGSNSTKTATREVPSTQATRIEDDSFEAVLQATAQAVRDNFDSDFFNEKIIGQTHDENGNSTDLRCYLKSSQNRTFKLAREAAGIPLKDAVDLLTRAVNG